MAACVIAPRSCLMREPSKSSAQETELLFGHQFRIDKKKKNWVFGQAISPLGKNEDGHTVEGYIGWMRREDLAEGFAPRTHHISVLKAPVFKQADIKSRVMRILPMGAQINAARIGDVFCELASGGFVHRKHLQPLGDFPQSDFVTAAEAHIGLPYIWGGVSSDGLDCSGLVQSALRATGRDCLRNASQQEDSLGSKIAADTVLQRGDLVFWPGHVGIMTDNETLLHANAFHMKVTAEPLDHAAARIGQARTLRRL